MCVFLWFAVISLPCVAVFVCVCVWSLSACSLLLLRFASVAVVACFFVSWVFIRCSTVVQNPRAFAVCISPAFFAANEPNFAADLFKTPAKFDISDDALGRFFQSMHGDRRDVVMRGSPEPLLPPPASAGHPVAADSRAVCGGGLHGAHAVLEARAPDAHACGAGGQGARSVPGAGAPAASCMNC